MFNSDEEFVMDIKAEEKRTHLEFLFTEGFDSDCTTISASEVESEGCSSPTPPLFCKLKKARVLIKKLPRNVLAKYNLKNKKCPPEHPSRSSGRLKEKQIPVGKYLALHVNKPLSVIVNNKNILRRRHLKVSEINQHKLTLKRKVEFKPTPVTSLKASLRSSKLAGKTSRNNEASSFSTFKTSITTPIKILGEKRQANTKTNFHNKCLSNSPNATSLNRKIFSSNRPTFQERLTNNTVPNSSHTFGDIITTKYNLQPNSFLHSNIPSRATTVVPTIMTNNYNQSSILFPRPQHNINVQIPLAIGDTHFSYSQNRQASQIFPTLITPASLHNQIGPQSVLVNNATTTTIQPSDSNTRTFTIQAFSIPHEQSVTNGQVVVDSPKVLVINQPSTESDPLDMPSFVNKTQQFQGIQNHKKNKADCDFINCVESDSDIEELDNEKQKRHPEVIQRIVYHTKSVQTRFTCNSSICGLVDSGQFNLNCFYCYDIFPLHKWLEFKQHVKLVHHVEEKENLSDSDASFAANDCFQMNTNHDKKLPVEPKLVAQRLNKIRTASDKIIQAQSSAISSASSKLYLPNDNFSNSYNDEIINLDSDLNVDNINRTPKKYLKADGKKVKNQSYLNERTSGIDDVKLILPTLPHIRVKKFNKLLPKEIINTHKPSSESLLRKKFFKPLHPNLNIQKVLKTPHKPISQQISTKGNTKSRYFVVKNIIQVPETGTVTNLNGCTSMVPKNVRESEKEIIDYDDMPANDEAEDPVPKPTNGDGILFGRTNSMVVIEFLLSLKAFPELWRSQLISKASFNCDDSIKKLCFHLNSRFDLNIEEFEMRRSIKRVKNWYYRILKNIHEHNKNPNNTEPYNHKFPIYFKILQNFLVPQVRNENSLLLTSQFKPNINIPAFEKNIHSLDKKISETITIESKPPTTQSEAPQQTTPSSIAHLIVPTKKNNSQTAEIGLENLIEFDADTLYDNESSDEEVLEEFDETKRPNKAITQIECNRKRRTRIYTGRYECNICRKTYKRMCDLKRHKIMHFPPQFSCEVCSLKFYFKHCAEKCPHIRNKNCYKKVDKAKPINDPTQKKIWPKKIFRFKMICEICGASYRSIGSLNTHKRDKHLNQRYKCVVCNFTALSNWRIVQHQRKRHIVELGTVEELSKKSRARTDTKTPFSNEARQEFFWRQEMRKKLKPGEIFYGCCKCRIIFNSRKEKVLHNKTEHPITETTVICLLCLPNRQLLSNSNSARRHYTDIHKVAWHEIDGLVKRTKPIFKLLTKEEIELLKASANYKELLEDLLKDKKLQPAQNLQFVENETSKAVQNLPFIIKELDEEVNKIDVEGAKEENVHIDGIIDHDYNCEEVFKEYEYSNTNEHNYSDVKETFQNYHDYVKISNSPLKNDLYPHQLCDEETLRLRYDLEKEDNIHKDQKEYIQSTVDDFIEGELIEESIVVEEYIDEVITDGF